MKKSSKVILGVVIVAAAGACTYRLVNSAPADGLPANETMRQMLADGGCLSCHSTNPKLPFYAKWPVAGSIVMADVDSGYRAYDIAPLMRALEAGTKVNEVDLAKVEKVIEDGTMPMAKYYLVHWGSSITSAKKEKMLKAIADLRAKFYPNPLASAEFKNETVRPLPDSLSTDPRKVALGKLLYFDKRLSADNTVSCSTCHGLTTGGVDNKRYSEGIKGQHGGVNAPTVFNAAYNFVQFWDGRAATLADQAGGPPLNPVEMGCKSFDEIVAKLKADPVFARAFTAVYPEGLSQATITNAIQEFERTLITPNSAFDRYLKGDKKALAANEVKGYELFKKYSCATCHAGETLGGQTYDLLGMKANYFADRKEKLDKNDVGRFGQSKNPRDRYRVKTPGLRNVALTAPYFHDGTVKTLDEAVRKMAKYQSGVELTAEENAQITAFLRTLTGNYQGKKLTNPNVK